MPTSVRLGDYGTVSHIAQAFHNQYDMGLWDFCSLLLKTNGISWEEACRLPNDRMINLPEIKRIHHDARTEDEINVNIT